MNGSLKKECTGHTAGAQVFTNALTEKMLRQNWLPVSFLRQPRPTGLSKNGASKSLYKRVAKQERSISLIHCSI
jgi:hypothetical protein